CRRSPVAAGLILAVVLGSAGTAAGALVALHKGTLVVEAQHERLQDAHRSAVNLALQQGAWPEVLTGYDRLQSSGVILSPQQHLDQVRAFVALNQPEKARTELGILRN